MARSPLFEQGYKPQFSGHETFPLRYGWLKKAFDAIHETETSLDNKGVFIGDDAIASFGVGRNMVASIRHWATFAGAIEDAPGNSIRTTVLGRMLFGQSGLDPYMEHPSTLWLVHWHLCGRPEKTTWFWSFNHFPSSTFDREHLVKGLEKLAADRRWSRVAKSTIKRDVECFVRTYVARPATRQVGHEDALESPLAELGLIKAVGRRDGFRFARGPKASLSQGIFLYALIDFWARYSKAQTLSFEAVAHEAGSPGRVFLLDENDLADRLMELDELTHGAFRWSETSGLKQVIRNVEFGSEGALRYLKLDYRSPKQREAA